MRLGKGSRISGAVIGFVLVSIASTGQVAAQRTLTVGPAVAGSIQRGFIDIGGSPGVPAVNPKTGTLYVPIQCPTSYCTTTTPSREMDVIDAATCNAAVTSGCAVIARARVGANPLAVAVDEQTDTVYTANAAGSVSVVDGALCNAEITRGCGKPLATIHTGGFPVDAVFNPKTRTLYVVSPAGDVYVIDGASCNALTTQGCGQPVKSVTDSSGPQAVDVDVATDTIYAVNTGTGNGNTVSVIDGATCNGTDGSGCGTAPHTITVGSGAFWDAVDQNTDTVYVANLNDSTVSVIDGAHCNGGDTSGCATTPPTVSVGAGAVYVGVYDSLHTVFALNQGDDTLSVINTRTCKGTVISGCAKTAPSAQAGSNHNPGYTGFPNAMTLLPHTDTAYLVNVGGENRVSVITVGPCSAVNASGCRIPAATVSEPGREIAFDASRQTIYASNRNLPEVDVINGATCNTHGRSGCALLAEIPMGFRSASLSTVDSATHTLYAVDDSGMLSVINTATCSAQHTAGCALITPKMNIGVFPGAPVLNAVTHTLYVPFGNTGGQVAVVNAAICNAEITSGCTQVPGVITVGANTNVVAVSAKTDTIYAPSNNDNTVLVISGATCNGTDHSGCGNIAATVKVGAFPFGVAVDDATNTVYVANNNNGDTPGTLSVINGATCNGSDISGCAGHIPTVVIGRSPLMVALDIRTDTVYVSDFSSAGVSVVNGSTCNAEVTTGCRVPAPEQAVGSQPFGVAVNETTNTVYAMNFLAPGSISIFRGRP